MDISPVEAALALLVTATARDVIPAIAQKLKRKPPPSILEFPERRNPRDNAEEVVKAIQDFDIELPRVWRRQMNRLSRRLDEFEAKWALYEQATNAKFDILTREVKLMGDDAAKRLDIILKHIESQEK